MVSLLDFGVRMVEVRRLRLFEELNLTCFFRGGKFCRSFRCVLADFKFEARI